MASPNLRLRRNLVWRVAGLWMVILAMALAVTGIVLAVQQTRSLTHRQLQQAERLAARTAAEIRFRFDAQLSTTFRAFVDSIPIDPYVAWRPLPGLPHWLQAVLVWDGAETAPLAGIPPIAADKLARLVAAHAREIAPIDRAVREPDSTPMFFDEVDARRVTSVYRRIERPDARVLILAFVLDPEALKATFAETLLPPEGGLELVPVNEARGRFTTPLTGPFRDWAIQPSGEFLREQRSAILGQTSVYLGLTVLALATLLVAMWFVRRVAKREFDLAELKANFVADVSHELKTPLALIRMFAETLQSGRVPSDEKRNEYYDIILRESNRLTTLINDILDFSRIEAGKKEYSFSQVDIGVLVRGTYDAYKAHFEQSGFEHQLSVAPGLPLVLADPDAVERAVLNLLNNAVKYSDEEKYVGVDVTTDTRRGRHGVLISVHDRGIGIRPDDRAHLTEGFFRASDGRVRQRSGTGLGLSLVKQIVDAHHGSLDVESRLVKGSTFRIFFPEAGEPRANAAITGSSSTGVRTAIEAEDV